MLQSTPTFIITLRRTPERLKLTLTHIQALGLPIPRLFYGVDGHDLNVEDFGLKDEHNCRPRSSTAACGLSHFLLWKLLLRYPDPYFLILEDDVVFQRNFLSEFERCYIQVPDTWQMLFLGGRHFPSLSGELIQVSPNVHKYFPVGLYAYIVKRTFLPFLIAGYAEELVDVDIVACKKMLGKANIYVLTPPLVRDRSVNGGEYPSQGVWKSLTYDWANDPFGLLK